jgi:tetratricopeptide (TPR) repeat protein
MANEPDPDKNGNKRLINIGVGILLVCGYLAYPYLRENFTVGGIFDTALELQKKGDCAAALPKLDDVVRRDPSMWQARITRGICHYRAGRYDVALADYNEAIRLSPNSATAFYDRGLVWLAKGESDRALEDFASAARLDPKDADAHVQRAQILRAQERYDEAIKEYEAAFTLNPSDQRNALRRVDIMRDKGDFDAALDAADRLIAVSPDEPTYRFARIAVRRDKGDIEGALKEAGETIDRWPSLATGYLERGTIALFYTDKPAAAVEDIAKAVKLGFEYQGAMLLIDAGGEHFGIKRTDYKNRLAPQTPFDPDALYWVLRLHVAHAHVGVDDAAEITKYAGDFAFALRRGLFFDESLPQWPGAIVRMFLGKVTPEEMRAEAERPASQALRRQRACDADFYLAEYRLQHGERDAARASFESAAAKCPHSAPERGFARAELKRLAGNATAAQ